MTPGPTPTNRSRRIAAEPRGGSQDAETLRDTVVLIPAAGRVAEGVMALSNIACPAMIPVAGRPVIYWTISYLQSLGLRKFIIAVARRGMFVEDFVAYTFGQVCDISFIVPSREGGVGRTVLELAESASALVLAESASAGRALVVLGDTHFQFASANVLQQAEPAVLVNPVDDSYRWCTVDVGDDGLVTALHDKEPHRPGGSQALIGVYFFPDLADLRDTAQRAVAECEAAGKRTELAAILADINGRNPIRAVPAGAWLDCGNPDGQARSHRALLQQRAFNELSIDSVLGTVTKRSRHVEKFIDEINYLRLLPVELAPLFPRVLDFSIDWEDPWVKLEYYGYPTLSEVFVFENVDPGIWEQIFVHLRKIVVDGFMQKRRPLAEGALHEMCLVKTRKRLESMTAPDSLVDLLRQSGPLVVNGQELSNINELWGRLEQAVDRMSENMQGCVVHGDLCLSNILYDLRSRICKLLDPRGSFGQSGIYGDPRYDVAKLYHSIYGLYDFVINDLFDVSVDGNRIELDICSRPQHAEIQKRFEQVFFADFDRQEILLLTGLLFASMPALHYDAPRRQIAMYARALQLLGEVFAPNMVKT